MSLLDTLPIELERIIADYKIEFEKYENQFNQITRLLDKSNNAMFNDCRSLKVDVAYVDLRDYLIKHNITYLKYQIGIFGKNHDNNYKFWDLDILRDDDSYLEDYNVSEIVYSLYANKLYLKFNVNNEEEEMEEYISSDSESDLDSEEDSDVLLWRELV